MDRFWDLLNFRAIWDWFVDLLPNLGAAILVLALVYGVFRLTRKTLGLILRRAGLHRALVDLLVESFYRYALLVVAVIVAAGQLGLDVRAALAGLGVAGIAVGFAAKDSLTNLIAGILIFWDKPFVVGDWVTIEDRYGQVSEITLRSTRIRTPRNTFVVIPNSIMIETTLENHSKHGELRIDVPVGIAYKEDVEAARSAILEGLAELPWLRDDPAPDVVVDALGDSSVDLKVRAWIDEAGSSRKTRFALLETAKRALDRAGIEIPFPHLQLFVDEVEPRVWERAADLAGRLRQVPPSPEDGAKTG